MLVAGSPVMAAHPSLATGPGALSTPPPVQAGGLARKRTERQCGLLGRMIEKLGETSAGHALRQTFKAHVCASASMRTETTLAWPWSVANPARDLPARLVGRMADWELRCGDSGALHKGSCAAIMEASTGADQGPAVHVHFAVAWIAGQESVLWRLFVEAPSLGPSPAAGCIVRTGPLPLAASVTRTKAGLMLEATLAEAARMTRTLSEGRPLRLHVTCGAGTASIELSPHGFKAALDELSRIAGHNGKPVAGR